MMTDKSSVYSPSEGVIYSKFLYENYIKAGSWPTDGIPLTDENASLFSPVNQPPGHALAFSNGELYWAAQTVSNNELVAIAENEKRKLLAEAKEHIGLWQTKLLVNRISETELIALNTWLDYIDALTNVDTSAPLDITWPTRPDET